MSVDNIRTHLRRLQVRLAINFDVVPERVYLDDVVRSGDDRVGGGAFADIWQGELPSSGQVAIKRIRISVQTTSHDVTRLKRVRTETLPLCFDLKRRRHYIKKVSLVRRFCTRMFYPC